MGLDDIVTTGNRGHTNKDNWVFCADGFKMSVIAGGGAYCTPRPSWCSCGIDSETKALTLYMTHDVPHTYPGPYTDVEIGFPNSRPEPWAVWKLYAEQPKEPTETVYGYVPVDLVRTLVALHGGEV